MAKKKCKCPAGVPDWVVTFGDMMSLLLAFFVLLFSMSELRKDTPRYQGTVKAIQQQFGFNSESGRTPVEDRPLSTRELMDQSAHENQIKQVSASEDPSVHGRDTTVTTVREGLKFTVGGLITFEPGSAELKPSAKAGLKKVVEILRGKNNKVDIRGHATGGDQIESLKYGSLDELAFARAKAVKAFLTSPENGIEEKRLRLVSSGTHEPLKKRAYNSAEQAINRRVEIIALETHVTDFEPDDQN